MGVDSADTAELKALVLDYGGVLTTPIGDSIRAWIAAERIVPESFTAVLKEWLGRDAASGTPIHRLESGELSVKEFDALLAARLTTYDDTPVHPDGVLTRLFAGMRPDEEMWQLAAEARAAGLRTALLSNSWGDFYPHDRLAEVFDTVVISERVGLRKPEAAIFRLVLDELGVDPGEAVFVDDAAPNIDGARAAGLTAVLHTTAAATRAELAALVPALKGAPR